ncbi:hypothetical protein JTB14_010628 [Gonioctena quinquepunctata]|nr:hypothetical protein JTB14_010628 [Gonioctena quinquepunctata]
MSDELKTVKADVNKLKQENEQLITEVNTLHKRINVLESYSRQNYIVFFGINEEENEDQVKLESTVIDIIKTKMLIPIEKEDIEVTRRIGRDNNGIRPVLLKLLRYKVKRTTIKGSLKRFINHFNAVKDSVNVDIEDLHHRLNKAEELLEQFNNAQLEIETEDPDFETNYPNIHSDERQKFENDFYAITSAVGKFIRSKAVIKTTIWGKDHILIILTIS